VLTTHSLTLALCSEDPGLELELVQRSTLGPMRGKKKILNRGLNEIVSQRQNDDVDNTDLVDAKSGPRPQGSVCCIIQSAPSMHSLGMFGSSSRLPRISTEYPENLRPLRPIDSALRS
jgi:hypothetical protein